MTTSNPSDTTWDEQNGLFLRVFADEMLRRPERTEEERLADQRMYEAEVKRRQEEADRRQEEVRVTRLLIEAAMAWTYGERPWPLTGWELDVFARHGSEEAVIDSVKKQVVKAIEQCPYKGFATLGYVASKVPSLSKGDHFFDVADNVAAWGNFDIFGVRAMSQLVDEGVIKLHFIDNVGDMGRHVKFWGRLALPVLLKDPLTARPESLMWAPCVVCLGNDVPEIDGERARPLWMWVMSIPEARPLRDQREACVLKLYRQKFNRKPKKCAGSAAYTWGELVALKLVPESVI